MQNSLRLIAVIAAALVGSACSHMPDIGNVLPDMPERATPDLAPRERVRLAVEMLDRGEERSARRELQAALEEQPGLGTAQRLLDQIERDPREVLGADARPYTVRQGETMSALAERFLGDSLMFYALARYNQLDAPNQLRAGQTLMIPRRPGQNLTAASAVSTNAPAAPAPSSAPAATATLRGIDPARANQLRLQALQHMNGGQVDSAVSLLRQAQTLDSENPAIRRDLDRALRLQASLRSSGGGAN